MCFLIGATGFGVTTTGEALIGSVSDDPYLFRTFVRVLQPPNGLAHVGTELAYATDCSGLEPPFKVEPGEPSRGVNSAGLAFVVALAVERAIKGADIAEPSVRFDVLSRRMMAECSSVDEALAILQSAPAVSPAFSVLLADASGDLAQVEVGAFGTAIHRRFSREQPGMVFAVNCYQSKELMGFNDSAAELTAPENNNGCRLSRGQELAEAWRGRLDVAAFRSILSDHDSRERDPSKNPLLRWWGYSICNHGTRQRDSYDSGNAPWGTVSAEVLQPSLRALHYNYGWPCGEHAEFPDQLFQSGSWSSFATFVSPPDGVLASCSIACTTTEGEMTADGKAFRLQNSA